MSLRHSHRRGAPTRVRTGHWPHPRACPAASVPAPSRRSPPPSPFPSQLLFVSQEERWSHTRTGHRLVSGRCASEQNKSGAHGAGRAAARAPGTLYFILYTTARAPDGPSGAPQPPGAQDYEAGHTRPLRRPRCRQPTADTRERRRRAGPSVAGQPLRCRAA